MNGKATCAILKQIRRNIAEKNDIALTIAECTYQGNCPGTCPRCEAEVRLLEKALAEKKKRGIRTAVAGISAGLLAASLVSCTPVGAEEGPSNSGGSFTAGTETVAFGDPSDPGEDEFMLEGDIPPTSFEDETEEEADPSPELQGKIAADPALTEPEEEAEPLEGEPALPDYCAEEEEVEFAGLLPAEEPEEEFEPEGDVEVIQDEPEEGENP